MKTCTKCQTPKTLDQYYSRSASKDGLFARCKNCIDIYERERLRKDPDKNKRYYRANKERLKAAAREYDKVTGRDKRLQRRFGITYMQYMEMLTLQNCVCAICHQTCPTGLNLAVDHDHETGKVRGLLCRPCNQGIGTFGEDPSRLESAASYLKLYV